MQKPTLEQAASSEEPVIASKTPYQVELLADYRYAFCACGRSAYQPFCDGSHTSSKAGIKPIIWTQKTNQTAFLCGCKRSKKVPFCDSSHKHL
jgi:CDGSH iron-sulfur domain-containing protein 3